MITDNLLFNTCRESSDHGAFNSWDRLPYLTTVADPTKPPTTIPAWNNVHHNFIVANYAADGGCLDNDDGSSYYDIHHNFCVFGGHKSDFDGNRKISRNNIHAYSSVYGVTCASIGAQLLPPKGYAEEYHDNVCILQDAGAKYLNLGGVVGGECLTSDTETAFKDGLVLGNNTVYAPSGSVTVACGDKTVDFGKFQQMGFDATSHVSGDVPEAETIIGWAKDMLNDHR